MFSEEKLSNLFTKMYNNNNIYGLLQQSKYKHTFARNEILES